jgi:tetratricopeptide (TPR) repeat protein
MSRTAAISTTRVLPEAAGAAKYLSVVLLAALELLLPCALVGQAHSDTPLARIEGTVRDAENRPVPAATVCLESADGKETLTAQTNQDGAYRLSSVPEGAYSLRAQMAGYGDGVFGQLVVKKNEVRRINLTLTTPRTAKAKLPPEPEFFDEPRFTVAGVSDTTNLGGHGSDTVRRTTDTLAKDTASLGKEAEKRSTPAASSGGPSAREAEEHHNAAEREETQGHPVEAEHEYRRAAELDPSEANVFDWGAELLRHGAVEPAFEVFAKGNRLYPRSSRMLVGLGVTLYARGAYDQAVHHIRVASDLDPDNPVPYQFLGKIEIAEAAPSREGEETLSRYARLRPDNAEANYYCAVSVWKLRKGPEDRDTLVRVESLLDKAVALDPKLGPAYLQLGILYAERKDLPKAISAYESAISASPRLAQAHYRLAQAYRQNGEPARGQQELERYQRISRDADEQTARERREIQQFVYTLRDKPTTSPP